MADSPITDSSTASLIEKKFSFNILYDTVDGVQKSHIDDPEFQAGDLEFHLEARKRESHHPFAVYMDLSEASKKILMPGYEIDVKEVHVDYTFNGGASNGKEKGNHVLIEDVAEEIFPFTSKNHCDVKLVMEFRNVLHRPEHFLHAEAAKEKLSDGKIVLEDDENKEVFVHKNFLAFTSPFFRTLFYGDFQEKDQDVVKLSIVKQEDFLDYLCCVYPLPGRPLSFKRLETLLVLADRFQNDSFMATIEKFLMEKKDKTSEEKQKTLIWSDAYNMPALFRATLKTMGDEEMKKMRSVTFNLLKKENLVLLLARLLPRSLPKQLNAMQNDAGDVVELYVPRKCSSSSRIISATDHAAVQIDFVDVDPITGRLMPGKVTRYAICGDLRRMGESDDAIVRLAQRDGLIPADAYNLKTKD